MQGKMLTRAEEKTMITVIDKRKVERLQTQPFFFSDVM